MATLPIPTRYLIDQDYSTIIQSSQKSQIIQNNQNTLLQMERIAQEEATSYINQRYDTAAEFTNTINWNPATAYLPGDLVTINYAEWISGISYPQYSCISYNGISYLAAIAIPFSSPEITPDQNSHWIPLGYQYTFYNGVYPYPEFNVNKGYNIGDMVYWMGYIYTCTFATIAYNTSNIQQYYTYSNVPPLNIFPNDTVNNANGQFWDNPTPYQINPYETSPGTIVTDPIYWNVGDNRCQQMVMALCDIAVYHLHRTIAPGNIPEIRAKAYKEQLEWLRHVGRGDVSINFPQIQPLQGTFMAYGGNIKMMNRY